MVHFFAEIDRFFWLSQILNNWFGVVSSSPICIAETCFPNDNIVCSHLCDEYKNSNELSVCHRLLSILWSDRASLLTDQRMPSLPIRARCKHFRTICKQTSGNSPTDSNSSFLEWRPSKQGLETFQKLLCIFVRQFVTSLNTILGMSFHVVGPRNRFCVRCFPTHVFFQVLQQRFVIRTFFL